MNELIKEIQNGRILKNNGSWLYCDKCNKTVAYLCYSTYQDFQFDFECKCGNRGSFNLKYQTENEWTKSKEELKRIKNRLCCPNDDSPLFTIVDKNIETIKYSVTCKNCQNRYEG